MQIKDVDFETVEQAAIAATVAEETEKPERVPTHVKSFYAKMMGMLDEKGVEGNSQAAKSMKVLAIKAQLAPRRSERFGRRDRQAAVKRLVEEGKIRQPKTTRTRGTPAVIDPRAIDQFLERLPEQAKSTPEAVTAAVGRVFGFFNPDAQMRASLRAHRFITNNPNRRLPSHIRSAAVMSTAVMVATVVLFPDVAEQPAIDAVATLRQSFEHAA
jgi:hypothetical protein